MDSDSILTLMIFFGVFAVFILFNGTWKKEEHLWVFSNAVTFVVDVSKDITYTELVDKVYKTIDVDKFTFDIKLDVPCTMGTFRTIWSTKNREGIFTMWSLVPKELIASNTCRGVDEGKKLIIGDLPRFEPNKRRNNFIINDQHNDPTINDGHTSGKDDMYKGDEDNWYKADEDNWYKGDKRMNTMVKQMMDTIVTKVMDTTVTEVKNLKNLWTPNNMKNLCRFYSTLGTQ